MTAPSQIRLLPIEVANKIAAGEVVERPASVLKELLENAFDAGASLIEAAAVAGGTRLVSVTDDGCGMNRDDALLSIERHATSKIRDVADLERIQTLGFRGEALAAVAAVSRFHLQTCPRGEVAGTELRITGGKIQDVRDSGGPPGTRVEVRDLFFNVPARRKFLRSIQTETAWLRQTFMIHALAHPGIGMRLAIDGRDAWLLAAGATLAERIRALFGDDYLRQLLPVDCAAPALRVRGYAGSPALTRADGSEQFVFVNGRPAGAPLLHRAVREGYHPILSGDRHPVLFLFLELDPAQVDVNVHPTKKEVRFRRAGDVRDGVIAALRQALAPSRPAAAPAGGSPLPANMPAQKPLLEIPDLPAVRTFRYPRLPLIPGEARPPASAPAGSRSATAPLPAAGASGALAGAPETAPGTAPWAWCRVVGQIGGLYVLLETEDGYVIMDPHAAHERVMFEKFMRHYTRGQIPTQGLLVPETVELLPRDALHVRRNLELLRKMGFGVAEFGGDTFVVDALPAFFAGAAARALLAEVAQELEEAGSRGGAREKAREEAVAQAACKAAVKAHDRLSLEAIEQLVVDLASAEMPYTCPHGRPTLVYTSFQELNRKFGRE